ncbi:HepT-like ribonuclease domain-containing protein [Thermostichus sp. MS-CIW-28]
MNFKSIERQLGQFCIILQLIGEAVRGIPPEVEASHPEIPWDEMRGMRNIVIHEYFQVSLSIIWQTIQEDLILLETSLRQLINP